MSDHVQTAVRMVNRNRYFVTRERFIDGERATCWYLLRSGAWSLPQAPGGDWPTDMEWFVAREDAEKAMAGAPA